MNGKEQEVSLVSTAHGGLQGQLNSMEEVEAANKAPLEEPLENGAGQHAPVKSIALRPDFQRVKARAGDDDAEARCFIGPEWFVFHPYSTPRLAWDMWVVILLIYTALMVPFALAFQAAVCGVHADTGSVILQWFVDSCFWFDILLNFRTAILDPNADNLTQMQLVTDSRIITKTYLKGWFWLDVMGSIPVQAIENALSGDGCSYSAIRTLRLNRLARLARLIKLLRLARLARWNRLVTKAKDALSINPGHLRLLQFVIFVFVLAHLLACILYGIVEWEYTYPINWATEVTIVVPGEGTYVLACPEIVFGEDGKVHHESLTRHIPGKGMKRECLKDGDDGPEWIAEAPPSVKYLISLYVTFTTLTTVGYGDITMRTTPELIFGIIMMALGASTFAVVVGNMAALLGKLDIRATAFKERMEDLDDFMHQENLPLDLRFRTRAFFEYGYNHSRDIPASIEELSTSLRTEVALHLYNDLITTVPFFRDCGKEFLTEVILRLRAQTLSPGDYLYEAGEFGDSMFFLVKGSVEVVLDDKNGVFAELREGSYFGENCVLGLADHRPVSVRAMTWCNLFCLTQSSLEDCIAHHPEAHEHFRRLAVQQTAEKTVTSAVKRLGAIRHANADASADGAGEGLQSASLDSAKPDTASLIEPPVVVRALARTKKGGSSRGSFRGAKAASREKEKSSPHYRGGGMQRAASDHGSNSSKGRKAYAGPDSSLGAEIIASIAAAQDASRARRDELRAEMTRLQADLKSVIKRTEDTPPT